MAILTFFHVSRIFLSEFYSRNRVISATHPEIMEKTGSHTLSSRVTRWYRYAEIICISLALSFFIIHAQAQQELILEDWPVQLPDTVPTKHMDSVLFSLNLEYLNAVNDNRSPYELIPIIEKILEMDTTQYHLWFDLGMEHMKIHQFLHAMDALNRGLRLFPSPQSQTLVPIYISLSFCYHKVGRHQKEKEILEKAALIHPDHPGIIGRYAVCAHSRLRHTEAEYYTSELINILRKQGLTESDIAFQLGRLFMTTDYLEAEKHLRTAWEYDPDNAEKMGSLAWVLIRNALKIKEGMELIERAIAADPYNAVFIHQQGYGHYLQGNHQAALHNLHRARELYPGYSYELENHIGLVEEALASREQ